MKHIRLRDDRKRLLQWPSPPARVVSLVPSDTYSIIKLGAKDRLVGRTRYCVAPEPDITNIPAVGGTKDADIERILDLKPDAVIANQEENSQRDIERLEAEGIRVFVSFPKRVDASIAHLARLAVLLDLDRNQGPAKELVSWAYKTHIAAEARRRTQSPVRAFAPIWMRPLMTIHGDTFISDFLDLAGAHNVFADRTRRYPLGADLGKAEPLPPEKTLGHDIRYPRVTLEEVAARKPEIILLPDEPHPFTEADAETFRALDIPAAKRGMIVFCDGKDLMWYGARSLEGLERVTALIDAARTT